MGDNPATAAEADLAWQSMNNACDDFNQAATPARRRSRKSWFETPPATKLDIAYEKKKRRSSGAGKRRSVENMETLLLTHFTNPPKIIFGKVKLGKTRNRHLLVKNPHDYEQVVVIEKFPFKKKFTLEAKTFTVPAEDCIVLTFSWTPEEDGNVREMVLFQVDETYRLQAFLLGCAESTKPLKKQKKGLLGGKVKRPFSILHTPGLACIRDNYSPQEAEKQLFVPGRYNVLRDNANIQSQQNENVRPRAKVDAFPPPSLESTAIAKDATSACRSKAYNNMADIGCSPTLPVSEFSPIPNSQGEIGLLVDSCCSIMQTSPQRDVVVSKENRSSGKDTAALESQGPDVMFTALDRKERKDTEQRDILKESRKPLTPKWDNKRNSDPGDGKKEFLSPDSFLNDSLSVQTVDRNEFLNFASREMVRKPRKSWTPHRKSPLRLSDPDQSEKKFLSPDSFLNDSIVARQSGIGATPGTPFTETAQAFNHDEFEKSIVSPNSFLEELNSTRNDSVNDKLFSSIASPAVLTDEDTHNIFMKQLRSRTVKMSLFEKQMKANCHMSKATKTTRSVNFSSRITKETFASSRRATFVTKKQGKVTEKFSSVPNVPSPRRATYLVSKKNNNSSRRISPQVQQESARGNKKLTRSQRFTNIHKAEVVEQKSKRSSKARQRSKGLGETVVKKSKKTRTQAVFADTDTDIPDVGSPHVDGEEPECRTSTSKENTSATITKEKPFMVVTDEERKSAGRELFVDEDYQNSSTTITKDKPFMEVSAEERSGSGKCLFPETQEQAISATVTRDEPSSENDHERSGSGNCLFPETQKQAIPATVIKDEPCSEDDHEKRDPEVFDATEDQTDVQDIHSVEAEKKTVDKEHAAETLPGLENEKFGSPSIMMNNVFVGDLNVGRMSLTVTKDRPSLSTINEAVSEEQSKSSLVETPKASSQTSICSVFARDSSLNNNGRRFSGKKLFGADPWSPSKSPILSSIFRDIGSPSRLPSSPDVEVTRRITLTVTKSRPSDALKESVKAAAEKESVDSGTGNAFVVAAKEETYVTVSESKESYCRRKKILGSAPVNDSANYNFKKLDTYEKTINAAEHKTLQEQTATWEVVESPKGKCQSSSYTLTSPMFSVTPHAIPNSPSSENSRRSTHVISKPRVLDQSANPRRLFPPLDGEEHDSLVMEELDKKEEKQSTATSVSSIYSTDSLEAKGSESDVPSTSQTRSIDSLEMSKESESKQTVEESISQTDLNMDESVFEKNGDENIPPQNEPVAPQTNLLCETALKPRIPESKESMRLLKSSKESTDDDAECKTDKKRRRLRASKVSPIPGNPDVSSAEPTNTETSKGNQWFVAMDVAEKDKCVKTEIKQPEKKPALSRFVSSSIKKRNLTEDKENVEKENATKKRSKSDPTENNPPKKQGFLSRLTSTGKKSKPATKGLAQSKLILVKKGKQGMPKHPLPFAAKNMYYDERWIEKQDRGFVHWLNFVLTPPDEYNYTASKTKVDAGSLNIDANKFPCRLAPTKEVLSIRAYTARRRLNRLRRSACMLYQSEQIVTVIHKLEYEVEKRRISVRRDRKLHADIGIKQRILDMLLCYNPLWLRMGLETVFGEVLPLQSNSDVIGLSRYILYRLLGNPDIAQEYAHPTVPHLYRDGYAEATAKHALKKFLLMVYFLDRAKVARLIQHDPCLFCKDADIKASKDMLIQFSRDYLSGEGDITKHLAYMGYTVSHSQTALDEFDYAVTRLGVDLRDGLRLTRVLELLTGEWSLVKCLRAPAISRLQKIHNIEMVFKALLERGLDIAKMDGGKVSARDIVDGHREKTLKILWYLIFHFQIDVLINIEQLREEVDLLEQSLRVKVNMQRLLKIKQLENFARRDSGGLMVQDNDRLELLLKWCRVVCLHYGVKVENFTVSFSDGRALCCLLHHYHPSLLPLAQIRLRTSQSYQQELEDQEEALDLSQDWSFQHGTGLDNPELFEELLANERENFKTLYEKVSELGGIPLMLKAADMSNTIPDEKVVVTYVSYLCGRLLDIRQESRAARVIQIAWKHYKLRTALREQHHEIKAARVIQARFREYLQRKRDQHRAVAAVVVQAVWRGNRARSQAKLLRQARDNAHMNVAVTKIQAALQGFAAKTKYQRLRKATLTLQTHLRGHLARKQISRQQAAAKMIQHHYRSHALAKSQRTEYLAQRSAAITLQRAYRKGLARRNAHKSTAATVLQRAWRGYKCRMQLVSLKRSVIVLQACVKMKHARREYLQLRNTTLALQERVRANKMGRNARHQFLRKKMAVIILQSHLRGFQHRREYAKTRNAVICIQKHFRGHKYRVKFQAMQLAATLIQRAYRWHRMAANERETLRKKMLASLTIQRWWRCLKQQQLEKQKSAAAVIQAAYRRHVAVKQYRRSLSATVSIQKSLRMMLARRRFLRIKAATIVLQHFTRLHLSKRQIQSEMMRKKNAIVQLQTCWRKVQAERKYRKLRHAVIVLQKSIRMMQAQSMYKKKLTAVQCLQHHARCYLGRKKYQAELLQQTSAAMKVQAWFRMTQARRTYITLRQHAVVLQSHIRCWKQRKMFHSQKKAAIVIQSHFRAARLGRDTRVRYQVMIGAALTIQTTYRAHVIRKHYVSIQRAAVKIQSWVRKIQAVKKYEAVRKACVVIQTHFQAARLGREACIRYRAMISAAMTIQTAYRAHVIRRYYISIMTASVKIQTWIRKIQAVKKYQALRKACIVIQTRFRAARRGHEARVRYQVMIGAAVTIQTAYRAHVIRKHYISILKIAIKIQTWIRKIQAVKKYQTMRKACIVLQRHYRAHKIGKDTRKEFQITKCAVIKLQANVRSLACRKEFLKTKQACVTIQKYVRMHQQRAKYRQLLGELKVERAAIVLQKTWKMFCERRRFQAVKAASTCIQRWYRAVKMRQSSRRRFMIIMGAAITIQAVWRGCLIRRHMRHLHHNATKIQAQYRAYQLHRQYKTLRNTVIGLQQCYRRKRACVVQKQRFVQQKLATVLLQKNVRMFIAKKNYQRQRTSVIKIQRTYRCHQERVRFVQLRHAAIVCQRKVRATLMARQQREKYCQTVRSVVTLQAAVRSWTARKLVKHMRTVIKVQQQQQAAQIIQTHYRAQCQAQTQRKEFLRLKSSVTVLQAAYRKWQVRRTVCRNNAATTIQSVIRMFLARRTYRCTRQKVILVQAVMRGFLARSAFEHKLNAITLIQRNARTFLFFSSLRDVVARRRHAACVIQKAYRKYRHNVELKRQKAATVIQSVFRMHQHKKIFQQKCRSAVLIQSSYRGLQVRRTYRQTVVQHRAATCLQRCFRGYRVRVQLKKLQAERQAQLELYTQQARVHLAAVRIQTWYRRCVLIRHARLRLSSIVVIQRRVRVYLERLHYLKLKQSAVLLQRQCRQWLTTRHNSAVVIQTAIRHWLYLQRQHKLHRQVAKIQALWKGYQARKSIKCKKINRARARCKEASLNATDDKKIGNRTTSALDYLLQYKSLSHILEALMHLDVATRLSPRCCQRLVEVHAVHVIYRLIRSCNRSLPHMELIKYSVNILLNLAKYDKTVHAVHDVESTEILVDLMQIYRDKGSAIFSKTCSLLGILALDPRRRMDILQQPRVIEKIRSIHSLVSRKNKVEERQEMVRAKLAASKSFNSTLPLPTPVKRRRIRPDWMLKRDSLNALQEPLPAINFVLDNLHLTVK